MGLTENADRACPTCNAGVPARERAPFFPFCSDRCRLADLGKWLDGDYAIPGPSVTEFDDLDGDS